MTIIDELLILLDDVEEIETSNIAGYFDKANLQVIFSALGRLVNRGLANKKNRRSETFYTITSLGVSELNQTLDAIKDESQDTWNGRWQLVIFDIPEVKRKLRDSFRNLLRENGYGILKSSVWISPWAKSDLIKRFVKRHNLADHIFEIESASDMSNYQSLVLVRQCWNWEIIEERYKAFLQETEKILSLMPKSDDKQRFMAKKLVYQYAEVVKDDPRLPEAIAPHANLVRRAHDLYVRIRPYCINY